jgi:hypothetical protein
MRALYVGLIILLAGVAHAGSIQPRAGDPSVDGKDYLLSDAEFRAALATARAFTWGTPMYRVTVVSATEVHAWYRAPITDSICQLIVDRTGNGWRVSQVEWGPGHSRPNQTMKPTAPLRCTFSEVVGTPCVGLSLSR